MDEIAAADALSALGNRTRLRLFRLLVRAGSAGLIVGELQRHLEVPASTLAHHLQALSRAGLVAQERRGREVVCRADFAAMHGLLGFLTHACCTGVRLEDDHAA
ncbi:MAG: transcriptional regulator [Geminicoccaceae bacterium]|nr:MAG: transcriptional regulator [Geminicoccaceae bacterium]